MGFAYEFFTPPSDNYGIKTYIVIQKGEYYSYIKYKTHKEAFMDNLKIVFQDMLNQGYQPLSYWTNLNNMMTINKQHTKKFRRK